MSARQQSDRDMVAADITADLDAQKMAVVERTWEAGDLCGDCQHCHTWREHHGPGLNEPMGACLVLDGGNYDDCPGVIAWLKTEREE